MGKPLSPFADAKGKARPGLPLPWLVGVLLGVVLLAVLGYMVYRSFGRVEAPLPANPAQILPDLPTGPPLPQVKQQLPDPGQPLTQTEAQLPPSAPVAQAQPAPPPPQDSGHITWRWMIYSVSPQVLGVPINPTPGYQFVALGVTIQNQSTVAVQVDHNHFTITADGRTYQAELISSAITFNQMPFLAPTTLQPGASLSGCVGYMIPASYARVGADWRPPGVPATVRIVRVDPQLPTGGQSGGSG